MTDLQIAASEWAKALDERWDQGRPFPYDPKEHERIVRRLHEAQKKLYILASEIEP